LYFEPLLAAVKRNDGSAYHNGGQHLTLMIDLKSEGSATLKAIVSALEQYPDLTACPTLHFMISGSVPNPEQWSDYPAYIFFDGRPGISYTPQQLARVSMISTSFSSHVTWDGRGKISED